MKVGVIKSSSLRAAGRLDAPYAIALSEEMKRLGVEEKPANARLAIQSIRERDTETKARARVLRDQAGELIKEARELDEAASLTYPIRPR